MIYSNDRGSVIDHQTWFWFNDLSHMEQMCILNEIFTISLIKLQVAIAKSQEESQGVDFFIN